MLETGAAPSVPGTRKNIPQKLNGMRGSDVVAASQIRVCKTRVLIEKSLYAYVDMQMFI